MGFVHKLESSMPLVIMPEKLTVIRPPQKLPALYKQPV